MKRDMDLIREILLYVENCPIGKRRSFLCGGLNRFPLDPSAIRAYNQNVLIGQPVTNCPCCVCFRDSPQHGFLFFAFLQNFQNLTDVCTNFDLNSFPVADCHVPDIRRNGSKSSRFCGRFQLISFFIGKQCLFV